MFCAVNAVYPCLSKGKVFLHWWVLTAAGQPHGQLVEELMQVVHLSAAGSHIEAAPEVRVTGRSVLHWRH